ncbi:MAG: saccharopine dehydrogenase C-terminal domain-containing protein [Pseudotabrizicola sp.]|uniref:saccharopine dehydrogenase C-terminal domain-containing protein n=1 Tax=Pseudotabrizicola sp. TaxID=2939647 RepID=UPI002716CEDD|nr:saccharopine dehydrogenase C-terminal domain-containing protein [Pseudotabrizicola sp.]MDO9637987.1 saccharopine dehydrogenase C-terminal domain-containing protein [Pseudotabrizicola sp.]
MNTPFPVLILGAGRMANRIGHMLAQSTRFAPVIGTRGGDAAPADDTLPRLPPLTGTLPDLLTSALRGQRAVILADPSLPASDVARAAISAGCHYLDISENAASGAGVAALGDAARAAGVTLAPGCGLAPGFVTALAAEALESAAPDEDITVFVGVLPARPENRLGYANIWGIEGLISEYSTPCLALRNGRLIEVRPLCEPEAISLDGTAFEAFTTAGSLDALARSHQGRVGGLVFKTLRYPGHLDYVRFLLEDMGLAKRLYLFRSLLSTAMPHVEDDRVLICIRRRSGNTESSRTLTLAARPDAKGTLVSAVSTATAAHVCATLDLIAQGRTGGGFVAPGAIALKALQMSAFLDHLDPVNAAVQPDDLHRGRHGAKQPENQQNAEKCNSPIR